MQTSQSFLKAGSQLDCSCQPTNIRVRSAGRISKHSSRCAMKRLLGTGAGLIFKGSGFYSTDYRSESYKAGAKKESAPKASESGDKSSKTEPAKTSSSGETKPAEKKSAKESA